MQTSCCTFEFVVEIFFTHYFHCQIKDLTKPWVTTLTKAVELCHHHNT